MTHLRQLPTLTLDAAKAIASAAEAFALARGWTVAVAVVDAAGGLILFHFLDDTQPGSQEVALHKARTAARFKRPTKALEESVAGGRQALLSLPGITAVEGGLPVMVDGRVIGAVGVSGMQSSQDSQVAEAGLAAFRP
jgi:glc operon protein GlcG